MQIGRMRMIRGTEDTAGLEISMLEGVPQKTHGRKSV